MTKGTKYYLEVFHTDNGGNGDHMALGVSMEKAKHSSSQVGGAVDEHQRISITSTYLKEKQVRHAYCI